MLIFLQFILFTLSLGNTIMGFISSGQKEQLTHFKVGAVCGLLVIIIHIIR
jgi:hypothetical protein